ncbi:hypothetical protein MLD38_012113 [Melastoma candidum]|uniref:Uncharacterized protein n=1 Tax=Melastoma candidum TaxID=119954 RepID=A0ACB9R5A0_9MYRT|nr:hypothetical protein MLD38_012113 [Melastoma candidum]
MAAPHARGSFAASSLSVYTHNPFSCVASALTYGSSLFIGPNLLGRDVVYVPDKLLSSGWIRFSFRQEGSNPAVVESGKERRKIRSGERAEIKEGTSKTAFSGSGGASDDVPCHNGKRIIALI